jgi:Ni/Fe-hydrogenase subunit HybB-like protein
MVILLSKRLRENRLIRALALLLIVGGVVAYRWDTTLVGQLIVQTPMASSSGPLFTNYFPSLVELAVGIGIVSFGLLAFIMGVKYLKVVNHGKEIARS